jgi:fructosamine-3-kinase
MNNCDPKLTAQQLVDIESILNRRIQSWNYVTCGAANNIFRVTDSSKTSIIVKVAKVDKPNLFQFEADALRHIRSASDINVPNVISSSDAFLLMEDLGEDDKENDPRAWHNFGAQFGSMHRIHSESFGYDYDNYLGIWDQKNSPMEQWVDFFYQNRIECYLDVGKNAEILSATDRKGISNIICKIKDLVPNQEPSLCHGDFWMNNIIRKHSGIFYLIDPAIHFGLPEADLAITQMYDVFPESFYEGYRETHELLPDWKERIPIYQMKELLLMIAQFEHAESIEKLRQLIRRFN